MECTYAGIRADRCAAVLISHTRGKSGLDYRQQVNGWREAAKRHRRTDLSCRGSAYSHGAV